MSSSKSDSDFLAQWQHSLAPYNLGYKLKLASQLMYRHFLERLEPYGLTPFHYLAFRAIIPTLSATYLALQRGATCVQALCRTEG